MRNTRSSSVAVYGMTFVATCGGAGVLLRLSNGKPHQYLAMGLGIVVPVAFAIVKYLTTTWASVKSERTFLVVFWSNALGRPVALCGAILVAFRLLPEGFLTFVLTLLVTYILFFMVDIIVLARGGAKRPNQCR